MTEEQQNTLNVIRQEAAVVDARIEILVHHYEQLSAMIDGVRTQMNEMQKLKITLQSMAAETLSPSSDGSAYCRLTFTNNKPLANPNEIG